VNFIFSYSAALAENGGASVFMLEAIDSVRTVAGACSQAAKKEQLSAPWKKFVEEMHKNFQSDIGRDFGPPLRCIT